MVQSAETFNTGVTTYTYDLGDRLTKITPPSGLSGAQTFTLDALGRIATETTGATTTTLSYVGTSKTVSRLATGSTNVDSLLGSDGSRLATVSGSSFGWLIPDLHGDIAGASSASLGHDHRCPPLRRVRHDRRLDHLGPADPLALPG